MTSLQNKSFQFDVAFSFLGKDEGIAKRISSTLQGRYDCFIYSDHQKELAGRDGLEKFLSIFGHESRVCVILHRKGWGETKWTRVEETAIKDRALEDGWEFLIVVALDDAQPPKWLPKTKLWLGYKAFGENSVAPVIDSKIQELGGSPQQESAVDRASRLLHEANERRRHSEILNSQMGVNMAEAELEALFGQMRESAIAMREQDIPIDFARFDKKAAALKSSRTTIVLNWRVEYSNSLDGASLRMRQFAGAYDPSDWHGPPSKTLEENVGFTLVSGDEWRWLVGSDKRPLNTAELAEWIAAKLVDALFEAPRPPSLQLPQGDTSSIINRRY